MRSLREPQSHVPVLAVLVGVISASCACPKATVTKTLRVPGRKPAQVEMCQQESDILEHHMRIVSGYDPKKKCEFWKTTSPGTLVGLARWRVPGAKNFFALNHRRIRAGKPGCYNGLSHYIALARDRFCAAYQAHKNKKRQHSCPRGAVAKCDQVKCRCICAKGKVWRRRHRACLSETERRAEQLKSEKLAREDLAEKRKKIEPGLTRLAKRAGGETRAGRCTAHSVKVLRLLLKKMSPSSRSDYLLAKQTLLVAKPSGHKFTFTTFVGGVRRFIAIGFGPTWIEMKDGQGYAVQASESREWTPTYWRSVLFSSLWGTKTTAQIMSNYHDFAQWRVAVRTWAKKHGGLRRALGKMGGIAAAWGSRSLADGREVRTSPGEKLQVSLKGGGCVLFIVLRKWR